MKNRFIYLITSGHYKAGQQLPTVRSLAAEIEVNYNTVSKVYKSLESEGYIESKRRRGVFVCEASLRPGVSAELTAENITQDYFKQCIRLGMTLDDIGELFERMMKQAKEVSDETKEQ